MANKASQNTDDLMQYIKPLAQHTLDGVIIIGIRDGDYAMNYATRLDKTVLLEAMTEIVKKMRRELVNGKY